MDELIQLDKNLFLFFNGHHSESLDPIMYHISQTVTWVPLYLLLLFFILKNFKNESWAPLLGILVMIVISDQTMTAIFKPVFHRLRPTHEPSLKGLVHIVNGYKGGLYGFASSHASNTLGLAIFLCLLMGRKWKALFLLFPWALIVSYSRIYLGVHYPGDILVGFIVGIIAAIIGFYLYLWLSRKFIRNRSA